MKFRAPVIGDKLDGVVKTAHSQIWTWEIIYGVTTNENTPK